MVVRYNQTTTVMSVGDSCFWNILQRLEKALGGQHLSEIARYKAHHNDEWNKVLYMETFYDK